MCRAAGAGVDPRKEKTPMRGSYLGPGDGKKYERRYEYIGGRKVTR